MSSHLNRSRIDFFFRCLEVNLRADSCFYRHFYRDTLTRGAEIKPYALVWRITELRDFVQTAELRTRIGQYYESPSQRGQCILFSVVFTPPSPPQPPRQCLASNLSSLYSSLTLLRCGLAYPCDWRGLVGARKKTSVGFLVLKSSLVPAENFHKLCGRVWAVGGTPRPLKA